jgi:biopolymer transport protein ExbD
VLLRIPQAEAVEKIDQKRLIQYVYVGPEIMEGGQYGDAAVQVDDAIVRDLPQLRQLMFQRLRTEPRTIISMRVDNEVETGILYDVQQEFREADALRINYSTNREAE